MRRSFEGKKKEAEKKAEIRSASGSKINMKDAEDTSLPATSSQALPIEDAAPLGYAKWIDDQTVDSVAMLGAFRHYRKRHAQVSLEQLERNEH